MFTVHSCKFRHLHDFTGEGVMSYLREHHPPTHDVTRHAESRPKRVTSHYPEICDAGVPVPPRETRESRVSHRGPGTRPQAKRTFLVFSGAPAPAHY